MFDIASGPLLRVLSTLPSAKEFELRDERDALVKHISRHEVEVLALREMVIGRVNKKGLKYIRLSVETRQALRLLKRLIARSGSTVAEDCRTISRHTSKSGSVIFAHRLDMERVWERKKHWSNWGARGRGARAVVVVPRHGVVR